MRIWIATLMGFLILAGCGDDQPGAAATTPMDGRTFISQEVKGRTLVDGTEIRLWFEQESVSFTAGCNHHTGTLISSSDSRLDVSAVGGTEMGCDPARHDQDAWLSDFLTTGPRWTLQDSRLTLSNTTIEIILLDRAEADPDRPLEGTRWVVTALTSGSEPDDSVSSLPSGAEASIVFGDGSFEGHNGCNAMFGEYRFSDDTVTIVSIGRTAAACLDPAQAELEEAVVEVLTGPLRYSIEADRLILLSTPGPGLILHADE